MKRLTLQVVAFATAAVLWALFLSAFAGRS
jgi:hypothetical protein